MNLLPIGTEFEGYLRDESRLVGRADFIAFPKSDMQIKEALDFAKNQGLSVKTQGSRTGLTGGAVPQGGLILNLSRLNQILGGEDELLRVQAGVTLETIEAYAAAQKRFFPPNPTEATATIGGIFATGAAGPSSLRYGLSSRYVQALSWLNAGGETWEILRGSHVFDETGCDLPDGRRLEAQAIQNVSPFAFGTPYPGLDLIDFLAGSEGKLGIATELVLMLLPLPSHSWGVVYFFSGTKTALAFGEALRHRLGLDGEALVCAEFLDSGALSRLKPEKLGLPPFPEGTEAAVYTELTGEDTEILESILADHLDLFAELGENEDNTWAEEGISGLRRFRQMRHMAPELAGEQGFFKEDSGPSLRMETDFSGPPEQAADYIRIHRIDLKKTGLTSMIYGHLLQNRLHTAIFCKDSQERKQAEGLTLHWARKVVEDGGKLVTENGVGRLKAPLLEVFLSPEEQAQRRAIKNIFDPEGRLS